MTGEWQAWVGREIVSSDVSDDAAARRWLATFDREAPKGNTMPQGWHWCLGLPDSATASLGADGHPRREDSDAGFLPPVPLPRRMWASSAVEFLNPLMRGAAVSRRSKISAITMKNGASGPLVFVDVQHETESLGEICVREAQTIVYREAATANSSSAPAAPGSNEFERAAWSAHREITPTTVLLFRYSAITFNSHRIHYDLPYATDEEKYRGLVVHGPLTATLLLDLARRELGDNVLSSFAFRAIQPAICGERIHLAMRRDDRGFELGAFRDDGSQIMAATAGSRQS